MSDNDIKECDANHALLKVTAAQLGEHFDSVIIIATKTYNGDESVRHKASSGNLHACYGAIKEWIIKTEAIWSRAEDSGLDD